MEGSQGSSSSSAPAPFLLKTYELVDDQMTDPIVSWSPNGCSFVVWNPTEFAKDLLPMYFKHNNFSSFVRQLNTYGFRKIDPDQWEFANEEFIRGQRHLLRNIHRRKPVHSHSSNNQGQSAVPLTDTERHEYEKEIKALKHDKNSLHSELQRHKRERQEFDLQIQLLHERFQNIEHRQKQLTVYLAELVQKPGLASILMQKSEMHNKKRRLLSSSHFCDESNLEENWDLKLKRTSIEKLSSNILKMDHIEKLEGSVEFWESFLYGIGDEFIDMGAFSQASPIVITEIEDAEMKCGSSSPMSHLSSPHTFDVHSPPDVPCPDAIFFACLHNDVAPKSSVINMNSSPTGAPEAKASKEQDVGLKVVVPAKVNDLFWEQCLTETPGSSDMNNEDKVSSDGKTGLHRKDWWNMNNVDNLTTQMGHLTPAM